MNQSWLTNKGIEEAKDPSTAYLSVQPLGQHIDRHKHRQIDDPHIGEIELWVVDQDQSAVTDCAIDQGSAQWCGEIFHERKEKGFRQVYAL